MSIIFLKAFLLLCILHQVLSLRKPSIDTTLTEDFADDIDITPFIKVGQKFYNFGRHKASWYQANLDCRALGGHLASVDNEHEMNDLSDYLKETFPSDRWWWLSGSDLQSEGNFYWYRTGERIGYADWSTGQPDNNGGNENCVHLWFKSSKYQMNDWGCSQNAYYICEADKPTSVVVTIF